jgi:hypothetical protein
MCICCGAERKFVCSHEGDRAALASVFECLPFAGKLKIVSETGCAVPIPRSESVCLKKAQCMCDGKLSFCTVQENKTLGSFL